MPLQLQQPLKAVDIGSIQHLDRHRPVFLLVGTVPSDTLVIKRDTTRTASDGKNMTTAIRNMKTVDPVVASKTLHRSELDQLGDFVRRKKLLAGKEGEIDPDVTELERYLADGTEGITWLKMRKLEGIVTLEGAAQMAQKEDPDKSGVRNIAAALNAPGGLEKLGQILAVDLFNGNNDRFDPSDDPQPFEKDGHSYRRLVNMGNVVLCTQGGSLQVVGLDAYAGWSEFRDVEGEVSQQDLLRWPGIHLKDDHQAWREEFVKDVAVDLETALGPRNRKLAFLSSSRLPKDAVRRILAGIDQGSRTLRDKIQAAIGLGKENKLQKGLKQRLQVLGWMQR